MAATSSSTQRATAVGRQQTAQNQFMQTSDEQHAASQTRRSHAAVLQSKIKSITLGVIQYTAQARHRMCMLNAVSAWAEWAYAQFAMRGPAARMHIRQRTQCACQLQTTQPHVQVSLQPQLLRVLVLLHDLGKQPAWQQVQAVRQARHAHYKRANERKPAWAHAAQAGAWHTSCHAQCSCLHKAAHNSNNMPHAMSKVRVCKAKHTSTTAHHPAQCAGGDMRHCT